MSFVHLRTHSHYSLLSALPKVPELIDAAKEAGMNALALTDNGNLYAAIEFYKEAKKAGIKPIIGTDAYLAARTRLDKQAGVDARRKRIVLLAQDYTGYKNLLKLVTASNMEGFYYKPRLDRELLSKWSDGLIAIIPFGGSDIRESLDMSDTEKVEERIDFYKKTFPDRLYLEISRQTDRKDAAAEKRIIALSESAKVPLVAGHSVYYLKPEDKRIQRVLMSVQNGGEIRERTDEDDLDLSFITGDEAKKKFKDLPEALERTQEIADRCNLDLELGKWVFPDFPLPEKRTPDEELARVVEAGFSLRSYPRTPETEARANYELKVIRDKGYSPYFLIVADLLAYARSHGILSNIRGSVSGSLVTYLAGITNIDPITYEIPFERFLNPDRPSAPDIDMDFADDRRDEMVEYARIKYGRDKVAQIGTFGTMMARGSVRDVSRALGYEYATGDRIAKLIPMGSQGFPMTIDKALDAVPDLKTAYKKEDDVREIIDTARRIEGCARHISVHAAGVVISPTALTDFTALQYDPKGEEKVISQYDMYSIEEAGLLKFDFLGLKNLSIIADTFKAIERETGKVLTIDSTPIDDTKTFEMLARGETSDLFQLNGDGMTRYLKELRPTTIHDINAMVALYRPGPLEFIPLFIERKHNPRKVTYLDPSLEPILKKTYGILVYQDDLLMMAKVLAGYTWGEVDKFRKAVGKKIPAEMAAQKEKFIEGCVSNSNWPLAKAQKIWEWIEPFAAYGFNKAHSVSYGRIAYQTAYLKANYPGEYMASILTHEAGDVDKIGETVAECTRMKIPVLPPSVNDSDQDFTLIKNADGTQSIRFGLSSIKNLGDGAAGAIINERRAHGKFSTLSDFLNRVQDRTINKKSIESLAKAGALDEFAERGALLANMDLLLNWNKEASKSGGAQNSLFGADTNASSIRLVAAPAASPTERLSWEKELLGLYLSGHPLDKHKAAIDKHGVTLKRIKEEIPAGILTSLAGLIESARVVQTKKGDQMIFLKLADFTGTIEVVVFPKLYETAKTFLVAGTCVALQGRTSNRNNEQSIVCEKIKKLE